MFLKLHKLSSSWVLNIILFFFISSTYFSICIHWALDLHNVCIWPMLLNPCSFLQGFFLLLSCVPCLCSVGLHFPKLVQTIVVVSLAFHGRTHPDFWKDCFSNRKGRKHFCQHWCQWSWEWCDHANFISNTWTSLSNSLLFSLLCIRVGSYAFSWPLYF